MGNISCFNTENVGKTYFTIKKALKYLDHVNAYIPSVLYLRYFKAYETYMHMLYT